MNELYIGLKTGRSSLNDLLTQNLTQNLTSVKIKTKV